jgi:hypothetical protein
MTDKVFVSTPEDVCDAIDNADEKAIEKAKDIADAKEAVVQLGLKKAKKLLEDIDYTEGSNAVWGFATEKRRKIENLVEKASCEDLTSKETLALAFGAIRFAIGQWPDSMDKHNQAEAASEFAAQVVKMAAELKKEMDVDCFALAQEMDDEPINTD